MNTSAKLKVALFSIGEWKWAFLVLILFGLIMYFGFYNARTENNEVSCKITSVGVSMGMFGNKPYIQCQLANGSIMVVHVPDTNSYKVGKTITIVGR